MLQLGSQQAPPAWTSSNIQTDEAGSHLERLPINLIVQLCPISKIKHVLYSISRDPNQDTSRRKESLMSGSRRTSWWTEEDGGALRLLLPWQPLRPPDPVQGREDIPTGSAGTSLHENTRESHYLMKLPVHSWPSDLLRCMAPYLPPSSRTVSNRWECFPGIRGPYIQTHRQALIWLMPMESCFSRCFIIRLGAQLTQIIYVQLLNRKKIESSINCSETNGD